VALTASLIGGRRLESKLRNAPVAAAVVLMAFAHAKTSIQPGHGDQTAAQAATRTNVHLDPANTPAASSLPKRPSREAAMATKPARSKMADRGLSEASHTKAEL